MICAETTYWIQCDWCGSGKNVQTRIPTREELSGWIVEPTGIRTFHYCKPECRKLANTPFTPTKSAWAEP